MEKLFQKTMREQVQRDLDNPLELIKKPPPKAGWMRIIRQALGMTGQHLAKRLGCSQSNVMALESREKSKSITLKSLEQVAKAMNCRLVYFFVPEKPLNQIMEDQAHTIAKKHLKNVSHSMKLEQQELTPQQAKSQVNALAEELLQGNPKHLWEE